MIRLKVILILVFNLFVIGAAGAQDSIELFGHGGCPACVKARKMLRDSGVRHKRYDLTEPAVEQEYIRRFGRGQIPVLVENGRVVRGEGVLTAVAAIRQRAAIRKTPTASAADPEVEDVSVSDDVVPVVEDVIVPDDVVPPELPTVALSQEFENADAGASAPAAVITGPSPTPEPRRGSWVDSLIIGAQGLSEREH